MTDLVQEVVPLRDGEALTVLRPRDAEALLDEAAFEHEELLPYWAELWPSGRVLACELARRSLRGARVVELGCGLGLPSIVAARRGARVLATDWSADALALLERNAAACDARLRVACVDWQRPEALLAQTPFDLVLAADVLYERRNVAVLASLLERLSDRALIADPDRPACAEFLAAVAERWSIETVRRDGVSVHRLSRSGDRAGS